MNWISMKEDQPKQYGRYLVYRKNGNIEFKTWNNTGWAYSHTDITHWMPLPKPPVK